MWTGREIKDTETHSKKPCEDRHTGKIAYMKTHRGGGQVKMEAELGVIQLQTGTLRITRSHQQLESSKIRLFP